MELEIAYWNDQELHTKNIIVEIVITPDYDYVPQGEEIVKKPCSETEVFVYGEIPEEIKDNIKNRITEPKNWYYGSTNNWEWEAQ